VMKKRPKESLRRELEHNLMPFLVAKQTTAGVKGWARLVRRSQDLSAAVVAERLGFKKREIMRIETAEMNGTVNLFYLRCLAVVMGYDVVYAFVPKETTFEEIAERERKAHKRRRDQKSYEKVGDEVDAKSVLLKLANAVRKEFRKLGIEFVRK
jgi:transcriptional regulator with XRE-family HTH domain